MKEQLMKYLSKCDTCKKWNAAMVDTDFTPIIATFPCEKLHMDYHFLPETRNHNKCLLVVIDHLTKKVWLFAHKSKESKNVVDSLEVVVKEIKK
jgi:hypothetical protein